MVRIYLKFEYRISEPIFQIPQTFRVICLKVDIIQYKMSHNNSFVSTANAIHGQPDDGRSWQNNAKERSWQSWVVLLQAERMIV